MNDIILSALLNLFALCGAEAKTDKQRSLNLVKEHLTGFFGVRNPQSYLNLYSDLRDGLQKDLDMVTIQGADADFLSDIRRDEVLLYEQ